MSLSVEEETPQEVANVKRALDDIQKEIASISESMAPFYEKSDNPDAEYEEDVVENDAIFSPSDYNTFLTLFGRRRRLYNMTLSKMVEGKRITQKDYDVYTEYLRDELKQMEKIRAMVRKDIEIMRETYKTNGILLTPDIIIKVAYSLLE